MPLTFPLPSYLATAVDWSASVAPSTQTVMISLVDGVADAAILQLPPEIVPVSPLCKVLLYAKATVPLPKFELPETVNPDRNQATLLPASAELVGLMAGTDDEIILQDAMDINGSLTITTGTLNVNSSSNHAITIAGNWVNTGSFMAQTGTVTFDGSQQTIGSSETFYNFSKVVSVADSMFFDHSSTLTIQGTRANPYINTQD